MVVHNTCNPDTTPAPETPEWRWLADVTQKYVFRRAMLLWMKKYRQEDKDGVQSYPWETKCLSAREFSERKVLRLGLSSDLQGHMPCSGYGPLRGAVLPGARPGLARIPPDSRSTLLLQGPGGVATRLVRRIGGPAVHATPSSLLAMGATISGGGKHKKAKASAATAAGAPTAIAPSPFVQPSVVQAIQGVQQVCSISTVVSAGSTVRLNRLHRLQPCTVERHLPTH